MCIIPHNLKFVTTAVASSKNFAQLIIYIIWLEVLVRRVDTSAKSFALCIENVRRSEAHRDRRLESRSLRSAYLFGDCLVPMCISEQF